MVTSNEQGLDEQRQQEELLAEGEQELHNARADGADAHILKWIEENKHRGRRYLRRNHPLWLGQAPSTGNTYEEHGPRIMGSDGKFYREQRLK